MLGGQSTERGITMVERKKAGNARMRLLGSCSHIGQAAPIAEISFLHIPSMAGALAPRGGLQIADASALENMEH